MGGCCCSSAGRAVADRRPIYFYCPRELDHQVPLSAVHGTSSAISPELLVDPHLEMTIPETYRAPPAPLPYGVDMEHSQSLPGSFGSFGNKENCMQAGDSQPVGAALRENALEGADTYGALKESDCKSNLGYDLDNTEVIEDELLNSNGRVYSAMDEDDMCPTCLEEYDTENPRIITKCEHHFHLSCILEWLERSHTCPVCDQMMMFDHNTDD